MHWQYYSPKAAGCNYKQILLVGGALCLLLLAVLGIASHMLVIESKLNLPLSCVSLHLSMCVTAPYNCAGLHDICVHWKL